MALFNTYDLPFTKYEYTQAPISSYNLPVLNKIPNIPTVTYSSVQETPKSNSKWYENVSVINSSETDNTPYTGSNQMVKFFINKGLTKDQAKGIVGNLLHESGGRSDILEGGKRGELTVGSGKGYGLAQWTDKSRQQGLADFAKSRGTKTSDVNTQLEYIWKELNEKESKALSALRKTTNVKDATEVFMNLYERPGVKALQSRLKHAIKA